MRLIFIFLSFFILLGAGCKSEPIVLDEEKIRSALYKTAVDLEWQSTFEKGEPTEDVHFGQPFSIYDSYKEKGLNTYRNKLEAIKMPNPNIARYEFYKEKCFTSGGGAPFTLKGQKGCCFTDEEKKENYAIMLKDNYILRAYDYFHHDCEAKKFLKRFWENF